MNDTQPGIGTHAPIYLDNHATTQVDPRVLEAMLPFYTDAYGNPSSRDHRFGWQAKEAVELARRRIAGTIGAASNEIIFTSGATESNNLALKGVAEAFRTKGNHIITCATEHRSVLDTCNTLAQSGFTVTIMGVDSRGRIDLDALERAMTPETILVSVMAANNEIGTIAPLEKIGAMCRKHSILFHTDAAQAFGKIPLEVNRLSIDLMSLSAHKIYGPKGIGALYLRRSTRPVRLTPQMDGGGQESGMRAGTLNVPAIVGFGTAAVLASMHMEEEEGRIARLRDTLEAELLDTGIVTINGDRTHRLPNNLNLTLRGIKAVELMAGMREIAVSTGSACTSEDIAHENYSHVLEAIGLDSEAAASTVRIGLGRFTTDAEIAYTADRIKELTEHRRDPAIYSSARNRS